ncbi:FAD-dependent oxidoreductase [Aquincola tertiaricarbonis]|uniref:FAD-dependent oxidoreductase n=1 Tax=Aquincola tertiaricarbonis TaxID=391953 RepID=A0ABY4S1T6_AQUTE|nr:FAD-dependent oxidoreductase [Aquincola tertiaricarbonis]URI05787.1 FAD-dependent oxidoreductase [Aquincola tertiaricarbonis]
MKRIVILGGGQAGGWAAHTLRSEGFDGTLTVVGEEPHPPYERPPLSKAVLAGRAQPESTHLFPPDVWAGLNLDWRAGARALRIDRDARTVQLADGTALPYDRLLLATGGRPRRLPVPGMDLPQVHTLRTLDDARRLGAALQPGGRLLVIGGGWIGLEVAATAHAQGLSVTVVEARPRLCERSVPAEASALLRALHARHGVRVLLGSQVEAINEAPTETVTGVTVRLQDGSLLAGDTVVVGVGLVPNDELAREAGLACADGVCVDAEGRSSDADIYAAGDVARAPNPWAGDAVRLESWQNAQHQGIAVARAMLGKPAEAPPLPWFWSDQFGVNLQVYGVYRPGCHAVMRGRPDEDRFLLFHLHEGRVIAALGANAARDMRLARRLIESGQPVDPAALADPDRPLNRL